MTNADALPSGMTAVTVTLPATVAEIFPAAWPGVVTMIVIVTATGIVIATVIVTVIATVVTRTRTATMIRRMETV